MTGMQRRKGGSGEREAAAVLLQVTGIEVKRRIRQHAGDGDLDLAGWSVEVKRHAAAPPHAVAEWWQQAVRQAERAGLPALLLYRADRRPWRACWSPSGDPRHVVEADVAVWWLLRQGWAAPATAPAAIVDPGPI